MNPIVEFLVAWEEATPWQRDVVMAQMRGQAIAKNEMPSKRPPRRQKKATQGARLRQAAEPSAVEQEDGS